MLVAIIGTMSTFYLCIIFLWLSWLCLLFALKGLYDISEVTKEEKTARQWDVLKEGWVKLWKNKKKYAQLHLWTFQKGLLGQYG